MNEDITDKLTDIEKQLESAEARIWQAKQAIKNLKKE